MRPFYGSGGLTSWQPGGPRQREGQSVPSRPSAPAGRAASDRRRLRHRVFGGPARDRDSTHSRNHPRDGVRLRLPALREPLFPGGGRLPRSGRTYPHGLRDPARQADPRLLRAGGGAAPTPRPFWSPSSGSTAARWAPPHSRASPRASEATSPSPCAEGSPLSAARAPTSLPCPAGLASTCCSSSRPARSRPPGPTRPSTRFPTRRARATSRR
jgi:hypothetical protein